MELTHRFTVPADVATTFAAFDDVESVAECFPGAEVTSVDGDAFTGGVKIKLGPISLTFRGEGEFREKSLAKDGSSGRMVLSARGKDRRGNGTAGAEAVVALRPGAARADGGPATDVEVTTDLQIGGKVASIGRGLVQEVSTTMLGRFTDCLEKKLT
ncbi:SRPBCC family protein [Myceligenerans pegani]|uniref:SRPBCC family protein n=1 Tax=Myceligenerans pegani TaxID=2776917 RepID=A0ABR9MWJ1_9MICO|nr:SRPBCC family protein [Myceligenerans sp. TRM 65318]MBE1875748.1 SRPBCC family protein [Myceligenerans sp. TRM 65318]MBE3018019.1 SRPBCC family protein [Myceligenerans sp. TRM 65318]